MAFECFSHFRVYQCNMKLNNSLWWKHINNLNSNTHKKTQPWRDSLYWTMRGFFMFNHDGILYSQPWGDSLYSTLRGFFIFNHYVFYIKPWGDSLYSSMTGFFILNHEGILYIHRWRDSLYSTMRGFFIFNLEGILYIQPWYYLIFKHDISPIIQWHNVAFGDILIEY